MWAGVVILKYFNSFGMAEFLRAVLIPGAREINRPTWIFVPMGAVINLKRIPFQYQGGMILQCTIMLHNITLCIYSLKGVVIRL